MLVRYVTLPVLALLLLTPGRSWALVQEAYGNRPLTQFANLAGIGDVINQETRVLYRSEGRTTHTFLFRGDTKQLNEALRNFAMMDGKFREVVLRPGPAVEHSFDKKKRIPHNWQLKFHRGRNAEVSDFDKGELVWDRWPVLTVYVGGDIKLEHLEIPKGIVLADVGDLTRRYRHAIATSTDSRVCGYGIDFLARLSPYDEENLAVVAKLLDDKDKWIPRSAVRALPEFGAKAKPHLPALRRCLESDVPYMKKFAEESIKTIENAKENPAAEKDFLATQEAIKRFCKMRPKRKTDAAP